MENAYAVILAGGSGTRFWPKSRRRSPKQLCVLGGGKRTMLEVTLDRLDGLIPPERRLIVTHWEQAEETRSIVQGKCLEVLAEPEARNTAPALAWAALHIRKLAGGRPATMFSLHADHLIEDRAGFQSSLRQAERVAQTEVLTLIGLKPRGPETGFGYIERGETLAVERGFRVKRFCEKPPRAEAERYVASGNFYWNTGLFVWRVDTLLEEFQRYLPAVKEPLETLLKNSSKITTEDLRSCYQRLTKISVDDGILELSNRVAVVEASFDWQDVGSWDALSQCFKTDAEGNLQFGDVMLLDSKDSTIDSDGPLVAALGLENMVVVAAKGAVLVCPKHRAQEVKKIVEALEKKGQTQWL